MLKITTCNDVTRFDLARTLVGRGRYWTAAHLLDGSDGEVIETEHYRFQAVYTPGRSPDHICLYEPDQGWLFSGDLFVGGQDRALRGGYEVGHHFLAQTNRRIAGNHPLSRQRPRAPQPSGRTRG